jgi:exodeoxyribonuclease VII small subunit
VALPSDLTYEAALARLGEIVRRMEDGRLPLQESLDLFAEGTELGAFCESLLDQAELRVQQLTTAADGTVERVPLQPSEPAF